MFDLRLDIRFYKRFRPFRQHEAEGIRLQTINRIDCRGRMVSERKH